jgi:L-iditol 2-dehydrogenase
VKKAIIVGERKADLIDVPDPRPKDDWVVVKVHATPMCTEYKAFVTGQPVAFLGHEAAGEVAAIAQPGRVKVGDRVVVMPQYPCGKCALCVAGDYIHCENNYDFEAFIGTREGSATYAQYLLKPSWLLPPIPDGVSYEHASLACCALGPTFGAFDLMGVGAFDTVLITGAGAVGLGGVVNARFRGARVVVVESIPYRAERAKKLGAEAVIDPGSDTCLEQIRSLTGGIGVDMAVDCSGVVQAQRLCIDALRRKGHLAFVGAGNQELGIRDWSDMIMKGLTLHGAWHYNLSRFPTVMKVIQEASAIEHLISHVLPMSEIQTAFELSASHKCAKIILRPWE